MRREPAINDDPSRGGVAQNRDMNAEFNFKRAVDLGLCWQSSADSAKEGSAAPWWRVAQNGAGPCAGCVQGALRASAGGGANTVPGCRGRERAGGAWARGTAGRRDFLLSWCSLLVRLAWIACSGERGSADTSVIAPLIYQMSPGQTLSLGSYIELPRWLMPE